jgi:Protein of unknown function with PCYCGC motif
MMVARLTCICVLLGAAVAPRPLRENACGTFETQPTAERHAYHDHPSLEPVPATLSPEQFKDDRATFIAYWLAGEIRDLLYQEPCYCPCDKQDGHQSLLDCFTSDHGARCVICRKEAVLCYRWHKKGRTARQIREAMANGKAWKFDVDKYVDHLAAKLHREQR